MTLSLPDGISSLPARECSCSFCTRHGALWTSIRGAALHIQVSDPALAGCYEFGTRTAQFHVCRRCGVVAAATSWIEGRLYAVVNLKACDGVPEAMLRRTPVTFEEESQPVRLERRKRTWIDDVVGWPP